MESVYPRHAGRIWVRKVEIWEHLTEPTHSVVMVSEGAELTTKTGSCSCRGAKAYLDGDDHFLDCTNLQTQN